MRLIDKEALKASIRAKFKELPDRCEINEVINAAPTIHAIPVEWLREKMKTPCMTCANPFDYVLVAWQDEQKEQEAR